MRKNKLSKLNIVVLFLLTAFLVSCGKNNDDEAGVVLSEADDSDVMYELSMVQRGDVTLSETLYFTYKGEKEESFSFYAEGRKVMFVYVEEGSSVKKGDIIARLECDDLESEIEEQSYQIKRETLLKEQEKQLHDYDVANGNQTDSSYDRRMRDYDDSIRLHRMRLEELSKELKGCEIVASFDGRISYMAPGLKGSMSKPEMPVVTLTDPGECSFVPGDPEACDFITEGMTINLVSGSGSVIETVAGIRQDKTIALFITGDNTVTVGTRVSFMHILDEAKDTLYVPSTAVHFSDKGDYVYVLGENGIREIKEVETGLRGNSETEITEGFCEGDLVIRR